MIQKVLYALNSQGFEETFVQIQEFQQCVSCCSTNMLLVLIPLTIDLIEQWALTAIQYMVRNAFLSINISVPETSNYLGAAYQRLNSQVFECSVMSVT